MGKLRDGYKVKPVNAEDEMDISERLELIDMFIVSFALLAPRPKTSRNIREKS